MNGILSDIFVTKRSYSQSLEKIIDIIKSFQTNSRIKKMYFDEERLEFFFVADKFSIVIELEKIGSDIILYFTTATKLRLNLPKTYTLGMIGYIEAKLV